MHGHSKGLQAQGVGRTIPCGEAVGLLCKLTTPITYVRYILLMEYQASYSIFPSRQLSLNYILSSKMKQLKENKST